MKTDYGTVKIADNLELDGISLLVSATGIIGQRGSGKTGLEKVIMEQFIPLKLPFVAFDRMGILWGLKSSFDGKGKGLPITVIGGDHADIPLNTKAGAIMAQAIVRMNTSVILDFSLESKRAYKQFVSEFGDELIRVNKSPRAVVVDEAPDLVPQTLRDKDVWAGRAFDTVQRLVTMGRNKGLGAILIAQRVATINKDVLSQVQSLFVFNQVDPHDIKAMKDWFQSFGNTPEQKKLLDEMISALPTLETRNAYFWSQSTLGGRYSRRSTLPHSRPSTQT